MTRFAHALLLGTVLHLAAFGVQAAQLEQKGHPDSPVATMSTYGMEVATRNALRTIVPAGWQLYIHKDANLPEAMSWKLGESWPSVLAEFAASSKLAVLIDWPTRSVLIRSPEVAGEENTKRAEAANAAITPLPSFSEAVSAQRAPAPGRVHERAPLADAGLVRTNPTPAMAAASEANLRDGRVQPPRGSGDFGYTEATALNKAQARTIAQGIANRYGLRLMWAGPELKMNNPVTLLAQSADEDVLLLNKAMGAFSPVVLELEPGAKRLWAVPRGMAGRQLLTPELMRAAHEASVTPLPPVTEGPQPVRVSGLSKGPIKLEMPARMTLEDALVRLAKAQGYTIEWKVPGGFQANRDMSYEAASMSALLAQVLPPLGISADVYTRDKHIVVRPADAARDR